MRRGGRSSSRSPDPEFVAARKRFEQRRRVRWAATAFAAFFVMLALAMAVALIVRSANAL
jgi:hypothetical protein